ncbi:MAG: alpha-glucan family phosphorylase [Planctomycetaceae bacterium]|nr:alpha-glucan family phosphorylase [Planctomycetaceae bacterium]
MEVRKIAYFSMEIGLNPAMPTYSGGLGVLAGDTVMAAADMKIPMAAVTLLYRKGYFYQRLEKDGWQTEEPVEWSPEDFAVRVEPKIIVTVEGRPVKVAAWEYPVKGIAGHTVPVYLLDTDLEENAPQDRHLTDTLYGWDARYRLSQEIILGIGGVRMLRALGHTKIERFHMNEGHASLLTVELLDEQLKGRQPETITADDVAAVRRQCVFTTHTPVAAGHDKFPMDLVRQLFGPHEAFALENVFCCGNQLNMTYLAMNLSHYVNGVAKQHGEVSRAMFEGYKIDAITNGVCPSRWTSEYFQQLFDKHIPGWREDNFSLRYALSISASEIADTHRLNKRRLIEHVNQQTNIGMDLDVLTLGFARRMTSYKRPDLLFTDCERLRSIVRQAGPIQIVYSGKAHPKDTDGKELIKKVFAAGRQLRSDIKIAYLPNYDMWTGQLLTAGVDIWLNTPQPPMEASGTSGMKAALNGVPSLSVLDGWWIEGCIEGVTGWAIGEDHHKPAQTDSKQDAEFLYDKLEKVVQLFYREPERFSTVMAHAIALNGSFFNTQRMMQQYVVKAYF